jgi:hypothetical protein
LVPNTSKAESGQSYGTSGSGVSVEITSERHLSPKCKSFKFECLAFIYASLRALKQS